MPIISFFFGILIRINFRDHNPPHFHADYQGFSDTFKIEDGSFLDGEFPPKLTKIITDWAKENKSALLENWNCA